MDTKILWLSDTQYDKFAPRKEEQDLIFANMLEFAQRLPGRRRSLSSTSSTRTLARTSLLSASTTAY